ncbi:hypothetical protein P153DRAFT_141415 [Dothidotthia symphoricarpi CBS 119687]|uniref:Uncharacterized protein n=1 Tax=Dothidotthia symphoricarpi CBS 119687 TaxID=1392245 RepID=A0A6A5ZYT3_9PLEO|nr:uncharacterized protein P153DRAFT_141415 [Dothidotthia symphoricarpi CBS 119687]KAF2123937.1 hypothetical protein P153DRAFT_141415 [Dothidotthia symphoricarpi CBS 119687]
MFFIRTFCFWCRGSGDLIYSLSWLMFCGGFGGWSKGMYRLGWVELSAWNKNGFHLAFM